MVTRLRGWHYLQQQKGLASGEIGYGTIPKGPNHLLYKAIYLRLWIAAINVLFTRSRNRESFSRMAKGDQRTPMRKVLLVSRNYSLRDVGVDASA